MYQSKGIFLLFIIIFVSLVLFFKLRLNRNMQKLFFDRFSVISNFDTILKCLCRDIIVKIKECILIFSATLFASSLKVTSFHIIIHHHYIHSNIKNLHQILQEYYPFTIGDYVIVNNKDYGYVITIRNNNIDIKVKYSFTNVIQGIRVYDCQIEAFVNNTHLRFRHECHVRTAPRILPNNTTRRLLSTTEKLNLTPIQKLKEAI